MSHRLCSHTDTSQALLETVHHHVALRQLCPFSLPSRSHTHAVTTTITSTLLPCFPPLFQQPEKKETISQRAAQLPTPHPHMELNHFHLSLIQQRWAVLPGQAPSPTRPAAHSSLTAQSVAPGSVGFLYSPPKHTLIFLIFMLSLNVVPTSASLFLLIREGFCKDSSRFLPLFHLTTPLTWQLLSSAVTFKCQVQQLLSPLRTRPPPPVTSQNSLLSPDEQTHRLKHRLLHQERKAVTEYHS